MSKKEKYDIPDLNRIERIINIWSPIQMHAYITDLYEGLKVRDREIEELKKSDRGDVVVLSPDKLAELEEMFGLFTGSLRRGIKKLEGVE